MPLLVAAGHHVTGATRSPAKAADIRRSGADAAVVDVYDRNALIDAVKSARPAVVIHQLTDLSLLHDADRVAEARERNARLRREGTANLVAGALAAGARRLIAQSIAFAYAPGLTPPCRETDPLNLETEGGRAVAALEREVTMTPGIDGIVLRYGNFYGPETGVETPPGPGALHIDAAVHAALLAVDRGAPGIYNIAEDDGQLAIDKARAAFGFDPSYRLA